MMSWLTSFTMNLIGVLLAINISTPSPIETTRPIEYNMPGVKFKASFPFNPEVVENNTKNEGTNVYKRIMSAEKENLSVFVAWFVDLNKTHTSQGHEQAILDATVSQFTHGIQDVIKINPQNGQRDFTIQGRPAREIQATINGQGNLRLQVIVMNYGILVLQGMHDNGLTESQQLEKFFTDFEIIAEH